jgi:hypothetical protein
MHLQAALVLPEGWLTSPQLLDMTIPAGHDGTTFFSLTVPENWNRARPRIALAVDVRADGRYLGQIAESVADIEFSS